VDRLKVYGMIAVFSLGLCYGVIVIAF